ncbi:hypothetical protein D3C81_1719480 [compost metagenome]
MPKVIQFSAPFNFPARPRHILIQLGHDLLALFGDVTFRQQVVVQNRQRVSLGYGACIGQIGPNLNLQANQSVIFRHDLFNRPDHFGIGSHVAPLFFVPQITFIIRNSGRLCCRLV